MVFLFSFFLFSPLHGQDPNPLMETQTLEALVSRHESAVESESHRQKCKAERQQALFPNFCLQVLTQDLGDPEAAARLNKNWRMWTDFCQRRNPESLGLQQVNQLLALRFLPSTCLEALRQRRLDLLYAQGSS